MNGLTAAAQCVPASMQSRRSTLDNLKDKEMDLEHRLAKVKETIALFEDNPNIAKAIDLLSQV